MKAGLCWFTFAAFLTGCFPVRQTISPSVTGIVIDALTHKPVSGAEAVVAYSGDPPPTAPEACTNIRPPMVFTKSDGSFLISAGERRAWQSVFPIDYAFPASTLLVKKDGFIPSVIPVSTIGAVATNVGNILLTPR
jgi:hypothetical protein